MKVPQAYIVEALRTAGGRRGGALKDWHPADMAAEVLDALVERTGIDPALVDDVIMGCVGQAGEKAFHVGRNTVLASKLPETVPTVTIDRQCGSSQQIHTLRRPSGNERHPGHSDRRWRRIHDPRADGSPYHVADAARHWHRPLVQAY